MQPWIIEEIWRREEEDRRRREEWERRQEIQIDAPEGIFPEVLPSADDVPQRGVVIIEL
ncbi:MAG: hypothetical protein RBU30_24885 [Polyangia bacterium]|nr:hypothetical protein [Polyangia bacterium]